VVGQACSLPFWNALFGDEPMTMPVAIHVQSGGWFFCFVFVVAGGFLLASLRRSKRRCPRCAEINPRHARFCAHCGAMLDR